MKVKSSTLNQIEYDYETHTLQVEFRQGSIYKYFEVPEEAYESLIQAESIGKYFNSNIKRQYGVEKVYPLETLVSAF